MVKQTTTLLSPDPASDAATEPNSAATRAFGAFETALGLTADSPAGARHTSEGPARLGRIYRGLTPDERRAARRQRLLDAGFNSFGTVGFGATTIEQLCGQAGVTPRHFYEEFPSREALLLAVYDDSIRFTHEAAVAAAGAAPQNPELRTRASIHAFVHAMCDDPRRARVLCIEGVRVSADFERHRRDVVHEFADLTAAGARELAASYGTTEPRITPMVLLGVVHELVIDWLLSDNPPPLEQLIDELTGIWLAACKVA